jgi:hypothetical protein
VTRKGSLSRGVPFSVHGWFYRDKLRAREYAACPVGPCNRRNGQKVWRGCRVVYLIHKGGELWYENPMLIGLIVGLIVNIFGYVENLSRDRGIDYDFGRLAETWAFYEPVLILVSQALPMGEAVIVAVVIDVLRRAIKTFSAKT